MESGSNPDALVDAPSPRTGRYAVNGTRLYAEVRGSHDWYNHTEEPAVVLVEVEPDLGMARFLYGWYGLIRSGPLNRKGEPRLLPAAVVFEKYLDSIALPGLPVGLQRVLFRSLSRLARRSPTKRVGDPRA